MQPRLILLLICLLVLSHFNTVAQNIHLVKHYWDELELHKSEIYQALPNGTMHGYRKTFRWDGTQDLEFTYINGVLQKRKEFADDGITQTAEVNFDKDGNVHGSIWEKGFHKGIPCNKFKGICNHGVLVSAQSYDPEYNQQFLDIKDNRVKRFYDDVVADDFVFSKTDNTITGIVSERFTRTVYKNGIPDSVFDRTSGQLIAQRVNGDTIMASRIEDNYYYEEFYINKKIAKAEVSTSEAELDVNINGKVNYGRDAYNLLYFGADDWRNYSSRPTQNIVCTKMYSYKFQEKGPLLYQRSIYKEDPTSTIENFYSEDGSFIKIRFNEHVNNRGGKYKWYDYNKDTIEINSSDKVEARNKQVADSIEQEAHLKEQIRLDSINSFIKKKNEMIDSLTVKAKIFTDKYITESGNHYLLTESDFPKFCRKSLPTWSDCLELFSDTVFARRYFETICSKPLFHCILTPNCNSAYEYVGSHPPNKSYLVMDFKFAKEYVVDKNYASFSYNKEAVSRDNILVNLKPAVMLLYLNLDDYDWVGGIGDMLGFWTYLNNRWVFLPRSMY